MSSKAASRLRPVASGAPTDQNSARTSRRPRGPGEHDERLAMLKRVHAASSDTRLLVTNYPEDAAVRHAVLKAHALSQADPQDPYPDASLHQHNQLEVFLSHPSGEPMSPREIGKWVLEARDSTVLTLRIAMGLWTLRQHDHQLTLNGDVAIPLGEILYWRGIKKHHRRQGALQYADGWQTRDLEGVRIDFELAASLYVRGHHDIWKRGKKVRTFKVDAPYLRVAFVTRQDGQGQEAVVGVFASPGAWITSYNEADNWFLTPIERRIFGLNPQNEQHELRMALYLVERWRMQAKRQAYRTPITMETLLHESVIHIDEKNLTGRFVPRIEHALANLQAQGVIGAYVCLTPVDRTQRRWGQAWRAAQWCILPPDSLLNALEEIVRPALPHSA